MSIPDEIERVALLGWAVFPSSRSSRAMAFSGANRSATSNLDTITAWCREYPNCNWGVTFGPSGLWGLDLDRPPQHKDDGVAAMASLVKDHGSLPPRPQARSGGGGLGLFFRHHGEPIRGEGGVPAPGMDPRRGWQSQTIPPSIHVSTGIPYVWIDPPWIISPPVAPAWLLRLVAPKPNPPIRIAPHLPDGDARRRYAVAALHNAIRRVAISGEGNRNNALNRECWSVARFLADGSLTESEVRDSMIAAARAINLPAREACLTIESAIRASHT